MDSVSQSNIIGTGRPQWICLLPGWSIAAVQRPPLGLGNRYQAYAVET